MEFLQKNKTTIKKIIFYGATFLSLVLFSIFFFKTFSHPYGWDVSYYINKISLLESTGIVFKRIGFIYLTEIISIILNIDPLKTFLYLSFVLYIIFDFFLSLIFYQTLNRSKTAFLLSFCFLLLNFNFINILLGLYDNLFSFTIMAFIFYLLILPFRQEYKALPAIALISICLIVIGITHIHTFIYTFSIILVFIIFSISWKSLREEISKLKWLFIGLGFSLLVTIMSSGDLLLIMIKNRITSTGISDASIPYVQSHDLSLYGQIINLIEQHALLFSLSAYTLLFIIGLFFLFYKMKGCSGKKLLLSWLVVSYIIFLFAVVRGSIPINRAVMFFPFFFIAVFGIISLISNRSKTNTMIALSIFFILLLLTATNFFSALLEKKPTISEDTIAGLQETKNFIQNNTSQEFVFVIQVPDNEEAAGAFNNLWTFWINAYMRNSKNVEYCVYFGKSKDVINQTYPSKRKKKNLEYNETSEKTSSCLTDIDHPANLIIIKDFNADDFQKFTNYESRTLITENILSIPLN